MCQAFYTYTSMIPFNPHNNLANVVLNKFRNENNFRNQATKSHNNGGRAKTNSSQHPCLQYPHLWIIPSTEETLQPTDNQKLRPSIQQLQEMSLVFNSEIFPARSQDKPSRPRQQGNMVIIASLETLNQRHPIPVLPETVRQ